MTNQTQIDKIVEALNIFKKHDEGQYLFHCEHDSLFVNVDSEKMSRKDTERLEALGFIAEDDGFISYEHGSC